MREKIEECEVNIRKIPISLEVTFWNIIISFLTVFKDLRTFTQGTSTPMPSLRKASSERSISFSFRLFVSKIKMQRVDLLKLTYKFFFWAMLGFVLGFLYGLLIGF
jgi:hypothetical protein